MSADKFASTKNYSKQGGDDWFVGGTLEGNGLFDLSAASAVNLPPNKTDLGTVADGNTTSGVLGVHRYTIGNVAGDTDIILDKKERVVGVSVVKTTLGGAGDTVQIKNVATAITDAMSLNVADKVLVKPATIDYAQHEVAAGTALRVTVAKVTNCACIVYVHTIRVA